MIDTTDRALITTSTACGCGDLLLSAGRLTAPDDREAILVGVGNVGPERSPHPHTTIWADRRGQLAFIPVGPKR